MSRGLPNPRETGRYFALAQVGMEMVAPIVIGLLIDNHFETMPWGVATGAVVGLVGGVWHLVVLARRFDASEPPHGKGSGQR